VQDPQIDRFGCRKVRLSSLKPALDLATFDPDKVLALLNVRSRANQEGVDCSSRIGTKRQDIAAPLDTTVYGGCRVRNSGLARANTAKAPPSGGGNDEQDRQEFRG